MYCKPSYEVWVWKIALMAMQSCGRCGSKTLLSGTCRRGFTRAFIVHQNVCYTAISFVKQVP